MRVHPVDGEVQVLQVVGVVQDGRDPPPVLVGHADDVSGHTPVLHGELDALAKDGASRSKVLVLLDMLAPSDAGAVDLFETLQGDKGLQLLLHFTLDPQNGLNRDRKKKTTY